MKHLLQMDKDSNGDTLDWGFIQEHTDGFQTLRSELEALEWDHIVEETGIPRAQIEEIATLYGNAKASIACWAMGITQHVHGVQRAGHFKPLLMKGNLDVKAGACPVRGHSNVQGDRTMGS